MIENIEQIESALKLEKGTLSEALKKEEKVNIELPELVIRTKEENARFESNIEIQKKQRYDSGVEKGEKEAVLKFAQANDITIGDDKAKKIENLFPLFKEKILKDAKIEPDKKINELTSDNEALKSNYKNLETQFEDYKNGVNKEKEAQKIDKDIIKSIPRENVKYTLDDEDMLTLIKRKQSFGQLEGKTVALNENGEPIKNKTTLDPISINEILSDLVKPWVKSVEGGNGGSDESGGGKAGSYEKFVEEMKSKGAPEGSEDFNKELNKRISEKTIVL